MGHLHGKVYYLQRQEKEKKSKPNPWKCTTNFVPDSVAVFVFHRLESHGPAAAFFLSKFILFTFETSRIYLLPNPKVLT